jgi:hypothetical protein
VVQQMVLQRFRATSNDLKPVLLHLSSRKLAWSETAAAKDLLHSPHGVCDGL